MRNQLSPDSIKYPYIKSPPINQRPDMSQSSSSETTNNHKGAWNVFPSQPLYIPQQSISPFILHFLPLHPPFTFLKIHRQGQFQYLGTALGFLVILMRRIKDTSSKWSGTIYTGMWSSVVALNPRDIWSLALPCVTLPHPLLSDFPLVTSHYIFLCFISLQVFMSFLLSLLTHFTQFHP